MSFIDFDKAKLVNLEYSLEKELLRTNRGGSYANTSLVGCNTRKYHGLLVTPQPQIDQLNHVLLSSIDETIVQRGAEFNLAVHKYKGSIYQPRGHKYLRNFESEPVPKLIYRVGGVILSKERMFWSKANAIFTKYTLIEAHSKTSLRFKPHLAFRNVHTLSKANEHVNTEFKEAKNGICTCMYSKYDNLFMQFSKKAYYIHDPFWYYNFEYLKEMQRGLDCFEDLWVPGTFEVPIEKGESVIFMASTAEGDPNAFAKIYEDELKKRVPRKSMYHCLINASQQLLIEDEEKTELVSCFPWYGKYSRDSFISLTGLAISKNSPDIAFSIIDNLLKYRKGALFPKRFDTRDLDYQTADSSLWLFHALIKLVDIFEIKEKIWKKYGKLLKEIIQYIDEGKVHFIKLDKNKLLYASQNGVPLTWMDAYVFNNAVNTRTGYAVEINALWYDAVNFTLALAKENNDTDFAKKWESIPVKMKDAFVQMFWDNEKAYLADYVDNGYKDWSVRPNQLFAVSSPYHLLDAEKDKAVLDIVESHLLTKKGLRTLSPKDEKYKGLYKGNQVERDMAYHNGSVFPWLLGAFVDAYLKIYEKSGENAIEYIYMNFVEEMTEHGIGSISEVYDGDPPHDAGGAISQAWNVCELIRIKKRIDSF